MVFLERLSNSNFENFKTLNFERINESNYDKNFFNYYEKEKFFMKIFLKKFVKLFIYNNEVIGYIWYEAPLEIPVRVWSLYVKSEYLYLLNRNVLKTFDNVTLSYEASDNSQNYLMLTKLGFVKVKPSTLMNMKIKSYNKNILVYKIINELKNNYFILNKLNTLYNSNISNLEVTIDKVKYNKDEELRCKIQNLIFSNSSRTPLDVQDIENDMQQDYYIEDLSLFIKLNNIAIGYGQVIYNREKFTVVNFGIIQEFRGYGFGKILLNRIIELSREMLINEIFIRVEEHNFNALKLYNWIGFTPHSTIIKWER